MSLGFRHRIGADGVAQDVAAALYYYERQADASVVQYGSRDLTGHLMSDHDVSDENVLRTSYGETQAPKVATEFSTRSHTYTFSQARTAMLVFTKNTRQLMVMPQLQSILGLTTIGVTMSRATTLE
jgi:hypothetical protein